MSSEPLTGIHHIIWDLDGTLLDSFPIHIDVMAKVLQLHGRPIPSNMVMAHHFHGTLEQSMGGLAGNVDDEFAHNLGAQALLINRSSDPVAHIDRLTDEMHKKLTIVNSLAEIRFK